MWCNEALTGDEEEVASIIEQAQELEDNREELMADLSGMDIGEDAMQMGVALAKRLSQSPEIAPDAIAFTLATEYDVSAEFLASELRDGTGNNLSTILDVLDGN